MFYHYCPMKLPLVILQLVRYHFTLSTSTIFQHEHLVWPIRAWTTMQTRCSISMLLLLRRNPFMAASVFSAITCIGDNTVSRIAYRTGIHWRHSSESCVSCRVSRNHNHPGNGHHKTRANAQTTNSNHQTTVSFALHGNTIITLPNQ